MPATLELLEREDVSGHALAHALGVSSAGTWPPMFNGPETRDWLRSRLRAEPQNSGWFSWYILADVDERRMLAGVAGYKGPPNDEGIVEIGYAVLEAFQRRGIASVAVVLLCKRAFSLGASAVVAETLPALVPSQRVLHKAGFRKVEVVCDPEEGEVWRYRLDPA